MTDTVNYYDFGVETNEVHLGDMIAEVQELRARVPALTDLVENKLRCAEEARRLD
jgi:hypothetical protein